MKLKKKKKLKPKNNKIKTKNFFHSKVIILINKIKKSLKKIKKKIKNKKLIFHIGKIS